MLLSQLLRKFEYKGKDAEITSLTRDSRLACRGSLFVCIKGAVSDGHDFALSAYQNGARVFLAEKPLSLPDDATVFIVENTREALAAVSAEFYGQPQKALHLVGITGTKGKTTTALTAYHILNSAGIPTGYIGSNGVRFGNYKYQTANTTPESCELYKYMRRMADAGIKCLVMEVSSQAIYLDRVHGLDFDTCAFTNLYTDHIGGSEHPTFEHYRDSKQRLFTEHNAKNIIYNADDPYAEYMIKNADGNKISVSLKGQADIRAEALKTPKDKLCVSFDMVFGELRFPTSVSAPGDFSVYNALITAGICRCVGLSPSRIASLLPSAVIDGRFETVDAVPGATFVIDYAHNGASLEAALKALREYKPKRLICLFGSVGGRTINRRRELGDVASRLADLCILTSDNPDFEPPENVIADIAKSFDTPDACKYISIPDRREAIRYAAKHARRGDIILLAGKGHEDYQLINGKKLPFSERAIIKEAVEEMIKVD